MINLIKMSSGLATDLRLRHLADSAAFFMLLV